MQKLKEKYLVFRISEGNDSKAFAELYEIYFDRIRRFVYFKVNTREDVEDLVSQVFLKTWEYLTDPNTKRVQDFRAFIYQLTRNLVIDYYRAQGRAPEVIQLEDQKEEDDIVDYRQSFFLNQLYKSDRAHLENCLKTMKEEYREVIVLRFLEDMEIGEVAKIMGKAPGNVRVLTHRALKSLKQAYDRKGTDQTT